MIELLFAMAILIVISASAFVMLASMQKTHASTITRAEMHAGVRSATELLIQEIGQAGEVSFPASALAQAVNASANPQTVNVTSTAFMWVNEYVKVDTGTNREFVQITGITPGANITGIFLNNHGPNGAGNFPSITPVGVLPQGIMNGAVVNGVPYNSDLTRLFLLGDINNDGTMQLVEYVCNPPTLTRSITPINQGAQNPPDVLLDDLVPNPNGTPCFTYTPPVVFPTGTFIGNVGVTLSTQTTVIDPITRQRQVLTKSFLNLAPRNLRAGMDIAGSGNIDHIQPLPTALPQ